MGVNGSNSVGSNVHSDTVVTGNDAGDASGAGNVSGAGQDDVSLGSANGNEEDDANVQGLGPWERFEAAGGSSASVGSSLSDENHRIKRKYLQLTWSNLTEQFSRMRIDPTPFHQHIALFVWVVLQCWLEALSVRLGLFVVYEEDDDTAWHAHGHSEGLVALRNYTALFIHKDAIINKFNELTANWLNPDHVGPTFDDELSRVDWTQFNEIGDVNHNVSNPFLVVNVSDDPQKRFKHNHKGWWLYISKKLEGPMSSWDPRKWYITGLNRLNIDQTIQRLRASQNRGGRLRAAAQQNGSSNHGNGAYGVSGDPGNGAGGNSADVANNRSAQMFRLCWDQGGDVFSHLRRSSLSHLHSFGLSRQREMRGVIDESKKAEAKRLVNLREKARRNTPLVDLSVDWDTRIFMRYNGRYSARMPVICDKLNRFLHFAVQQRVNGKINGCRIQASRTGSYKSYFLSLCQQVFKCYDLGTLDGKWKGQTHSADVELYFMDSVVAEHFDTSAGGLAMSVFEKIASGLVAQLAKRSSDPELTTRAPLIWTTQESIDGLRKFNTPERREMLEARHLQIELSPSLKDGELEDLLPMCDYMEEHFKVKPLFDPNALSREEMKLENVLINDTVDPFVPSVNVSGANNVESEDNVNSVDNADHDMFSFDDSDDALNDDNDRFSGPGRGVLTAFGLKQQRIQKVMDGLKTVETLMSLRKDMLAVFARSTGADRQRLDRNLAAQEMEIVELIQSIGPLAPQSVQRAVRSNDALRDVLISRRFRAPWCEFL